MRLIDADAAIDALKEKVFHNLSDEFYGAMQVLDELPSVQPNHYAEVGKKVMIDRQAALETIRTMQTYKLFSGDDMILVDKAEVQTELMMLPSVQPKRKTGRWILDRSGAYCCSKCMEPCAGYVMMKPRDKFCKMCGAKMEGGES